MGNGMGDGKWDGRWEMGWEMGNAIDIAKNCFQTNISRQKAEVSL